MSETKSHADGALPSSSDVPEPTLAERAKTLAVQGGASTLSTMSHKHPGYPFGSVMPYGLTSEGEPIFLISAMAMHTHNVLHDPRATLLITQHTDAQSPLGAGRVSLMGDVSLVEDDGELQSIRESYLARNPDAKHWVHYGDFKFFRMTLFDLYYIGGFGVMGWIPCDEYRAAEPDPLAPFAEGIIQHMNEDHGDAMLTMAKHYAGLAAIEVTMTLVDRLGFHLRVRTPDGVKGTRIAYLDPVSSREEVRHAIVGLVQAARKESLQRRGQSDLNDAG